MLTTKYREFGLSFALLLILSGCVSEKSGAPTAPGEELTRLTSFSQEITSPVHELEMKVGAASMLDVTVKNTGSQPWSTGPQAGKVDASYRWVDAKGVEFPIEGERTQVDPHQVQPGESRVLKMKIVAPPNPGSYTLWISMVQEGVAWFYSQGTKPLALQVRVD